jgi:hypothetical protein
MKFSQRMSRGGKIAIVGRAKTGLKFFLNVRNNGYVTLRMHGIGSMNFEYYAHTNNATYASYHDALNSLIDDHGTWTGDDDFAGVLAHPPHHQTSSPGTEPDKRIDAGDAGDPADCACDPGDAADGGNPIESVSDDQQAYMRCLVTACLVTPGDIAPVALVLAKATYRPGALQK